jgi:GAF domain-containing protein
VHIQQESLDAAMGSLSQRELENIGVSEALQYVVTAMPALFHVEGAGLLLVDDYQVLRYVAASDDAAHVLESAQEVTGEGPCVDSLVNGHIVRCSDLATDPRWPGLAPLVTPHGIAAVLGVPVHLGGGVIGSLDVYRSSPYEWDDSDAEAAVSLARLVERLLAMALVVRRQDDLVLQLQHALDARISIERAVGVLIGVEKIDAVEAFDRLRRAARTSRRKVADLAAEVIERRALDDRAVGDESRRTG